MWAIWIFVLSVALSIAGTYLLPEPPLVMYDDFSALSRPRDDVLEIKVGVRSGSDVDCSGLLQDDGSPRILSPPAILELVVCGRRQGQEPAWERLYNWQLSAESYGGRVEILGTMIRAVKPGRVVLTAHYGELNSGSVPIFVTE